MPAGRVGGGPFGVLDIEGKRWGHLIAFDIEKGLLASQCSRRGIAVDRPFGNCYVISKNQAVFILEGTGFGGKFDNLTVIEELEGRFCQVRRKRR